MNTNFKDVKSNFIKYLREEGVIPEWKRGVKAETTINIWDYAKEFKEYVKENYSDEEISSFSKMLTDLADLEIDETGKLVKKETEETEEAQDSDELDEDEEEVEAEDKEASDDDFMIDLMNELLKSDDFKSAINTDEDEDITIEELTQFFSKAAEYDGDNESVSFDDVTNGALNLKSGDLTFEKAQTSTPVENIEQNTTPSTKSASGGSSGSVGSSGGASSSGGSSSSSTRASSSGGVAQKKS